MIRVAALLWTCALSGCAPPDTQSDGSDRLVSQDKGHVVDLDVAALRQRMIAGGVRVIDVRSDDEVAQGMIAGADHIALADLDPALLANNADQDIIFYCRSGRRSAIAAARLAKHLGKPVGHLNGGILAWDASGGPD